MPLQPAGRPSPAPEHVVGGPNLASLGVITDLPPGVPAPPWSPAVSFVIADLDTGDIIAAKAPHAFLRPASTLKTLTALVALPKLDPARVITATTEDTSADGSRVGIVANNPYTVADLFNGLFLVSGNDAAYAIARAYGGRERILADMNAEAARLGAWDTVAKDPSGLDVDGQFSSAYDLALIGRAGMQVQSFRLHAAMMTATFPGATDAKGKVLPAFAIANNNPIIDRYSGTIGIKSGFTQAARNTFVGAAKRGDRTLIITSMGSVERQSEAVMSLLDWGFAYAGRARPVGTLVAPGTAARPPEWAPVSGSSTTSASTSTSVTTSESITLDPTDHPITATEPALVEAAPVTASRPWWGSPALVGGVGLALVVAVGALVVLGYRRRRTGGAYRR
ncbi:MAG: D-alanyl-D-alanine carboxypeptidase [Dermatophilaceae bacterium]